MLKVLILKLTMEIKKCHNVVIYSMHPDKVMLRAVPELNVCGRGEGSPYFSPPPLTKNKM